jgi:hypothetical protein
MKSNKAILIQANGNNERLGKYFKQPKYELYYKGDCIINHIIDNCLQVTESVYVAVREGSNLKFDTSKITLIDCVRTESRLDTLRQCFLNIPKNFESVLIHDCDSIIASGVLDKLDLNSLAVATYKLDGLKYGFVDLDEKFNYLSGNEKLMETGHIAIGAYSVNSSEFRDYLKVGVKESMLDYYNNCKGTSVVYSNTHLNLGDITSYMNNL